ncbi:MAG: P1 family peptidase, partial [Bryobacteraceae bacterium]
GSYTVSLSGAYSEVRVSALAAVNAVGDVIDPKSGKILAGARRSPDSSEFAHTVEVLKRGHRAPMRTGNTTLVAVATNARLNKVQAAKLAQMAQHGLVRAISPVHLMSDGDIVIALSAGEARADVDALGVAAAQAVSEAIVRAVREAKTMGGIPGLK